MTIQATQGREPDEAYVSVDIEAAGPIPGDYSMGREDQWNRISE